MRERAKIEDKLRRKEAEIQALEEKIKAARVYGQALRDVLRLIDEDEPSGSDDSGDTVLRAGSAVAQARDAIHAKGEPMHVDELLAALGKDATREAKASLIGSISAYVRRGEIFTRPAPNTFGLSELGHLEAAAADDDGPPSGFGRMKAGINNEPDERDPFYVKDSP